MFSIRKCCKGADGVCCGNSFEEITIAGRRSSTASGREVCGGAAVKPPSGNDLEGFIASVPFSTRDVAVKRILQGRRGSGDPRRPLRDGFLRSTPETLGAQPLGHSRAVRSQAGSKVTVEVQRWRLFRLHCLVGDANFAADRVEIAALPRRLFDD